MWTNVFRIGELQAVSWFQFFPCETDPSSLSEKSWKTEQKDAATHSILSAHLQLQNEGFLSTWTNSFVGPWDPSQGAHNPDEKIKLWLFLPGRHSSLNETAQAAVSQLRVFGSGLWLAPGDSEEVGVALSQALRNSIERALRGLYYVRFGDVFTRCYPFTSSIRGLQPTIEFIFTANEEAIYVHAIVSAKHVRGLCNSDMEKLLWHFSTHSVGDGIPVIVAPGGMRGRLTGCCPNDLVKQVYSSKLKASNGVGVGKPFTLSQLTGFQLKGQSCYVEVTLGCRSDSIMELDAKKCKNSSHLQNEESHLVSADRGHLKQGDMDPVPILERTFIYPAEAVLIPMMHKAFARSSIKSCWLQSCTKTSVSGIWPLWSFSDSSSLELCLALGNAFAAVPFNGLGVEYSGMKKHYNSSSNSITSSISSISRTSSESEHAMAVDTGDLEADADSLACRQSGFSSIDHFDDDGNKLVLKRPRTGTTEASVQAGTVIGSTIQDAYMTDYSVVEANNLAAAGIQDTQVGSLWDYDDGGVLVDIQTLLSEFGDFGDFFREEVLTFGEPPGTAESQALIFPAVDYGDVTGSPCTGSLEVSEKLMLGGVASLDAIDHHMVNLIEDSQNKSTEPLKDSSSYFVGSAASVHKFDYLTKDEAMMTFAPEYAPVETPTSDSSTSIFRSPYLPASKKLESSSASSNTYLYSATPPSSCLDSLEDKPETSSKLKLNSLGLDGSSSVQSSNLYTLIQSVAEKKCKRSVDNDVPSSNGEEPSSISGMKAFGGPVTMQKKTGIIFEPCSFLLPTRTVLATDIECIMFQSVMCRIRHTLLSLRSKVPIGSTSFLSEVSMEANNKLDTMSIMYDLRKKDSIPVRIAGGIDCVMQDEPVTSTVGVWRSVVAPKGSKPSRFSDNLSSLPHNAFNDEGLAVRGQRQPLQDLLDAIVFLVQQSTSFVDFSFDANDGYGLYSWLGVQEQRRREFACGPSMVHAGCGGLLATCHALDVAGVDLIDPLSADVQVSSVISLLQSDIRMSLRSAFGSSDGPLSVTDWCKGRSYSGDLGSIGDANEAKDSSSTVILVADPISPPQPAASSACSRDSDQLKGYSRLRPAIFALPLPSILVGYQDDWLKTSVNALQLWEKGPLEPYALPKPVSYYALCPDIDLLTSAAVDFFQQIGTVYELCKLGSHLPQPSGGQTELSPGKCLSSGLVLVDCPQQVKIGTSHTNIVSSISDYFHSLSKSWTVTDFIKSLTKVIKNLKLTQSCSMNQKESSNGPCTVLYVVCPFPEPIAVLQTLVECSAALGSVIFAPDKEKRSSLYSQVAKALNSTASVDEASASNVLMLSGFSFPKLILQIITVETLLRMNKPTNELAIVKDIAFTVYNKARRIPRAASTPEMFQSSPFSARSQSTLMHVSSPIPSIWKDCLASRLSGPSLTREGELDAALRPGTWDNSWQTPRIGGLGGDQNRALEVYGLDEVRYMFEPLFILAEPGCVDHGTPAALVNTILETSSLKSVDDTGAVHSQNSLSGASTDIGTSLLDSSEHDNKTPSLHCSYGWTEDWRWLICLWTDSRGELLDNCIFPFGGISSRQDTKVLQSLFVQILQHGCQILSLASSDGGPVRPRDIIITRIGCFFELECQEWQKAIYSYGGNDVKKWPLQLRRLVPDGMSTNANGTSLQQHDLGLIQERNLPSSPSASLYSPHSKSSFPKGGLGQSNSKKPILAGQTGADSLRGSLQLVQSISLVGVSLDHSLHLIVQADMSSSGGSQSNSSSSCTSYLEGFSPLKSLGSMQASYLLIPSPSMRYLSPTPLQLPTSLTSDSPPLAHLLHSKGSAIPLSTAYVVSKAVPTTRQAAGEPTREEWPSVLAVSLVDHYGGNNSIIQERIIRGGGSTTSSKQVNKDFDLESRMVLESIAAELHSLSWLTASPVYLERRTALPFHCDMLLRLRRLLHYADKELTRPLGRAPQ